MSGALGLRDQDGGRARDSEQSQRSSADEPAPGARPRWTRARTAIRASVGIRAKRRVVEPRRFWFPLLGDIQVERLPELDQELVLVDFNPIKDSKIGELSARFDVVVGVTPADAPK